MSYDWGRTMNEDKPAILSEESLEKAKMVEEYIREHIRKHIASETCWCKPELDYTDPDTGVSVYVHRRTQ